MSLNIGDIEDIIYDSYPIYREFFKQPMELIIGCSWLIMIQEGTVMGNNGMIIGS